MSQSVAEERMFRNSSTALYTPASTTRSRRSPAQAMISSGDKRSAFPGVPDRPLQNALFLLAVISTLPHIQR